MLLFNRYWHGGASLGVTVSEKIGMKDIRTDGYIDFNMVLLNTKPSNGVDIGPKKGLSAGGRQFWLACRYCWSPNSPSWCTNNRNLDNPLGNIDSDHCGAVFGVHLFSVDF